MAHITGHYAVRNGKGYFVKDHDDKRASRVDSGMQKMRDTITGLLRTPEGQKEFSDKIKAGGFRRSIPEVGDLYGVEQGVHHPLRDAFDHTMEVVRRLPADASDTLRWGAILHDIGKRDTQRPHPRCGVTFNGHEYVGYKQSKPVLNRLGFSDADTDKIRFLVRNHGALRKTFLRGSEDETKELMENPHFDDLLKLHEADVRASARDPQEVLDKVTELRAKTAGVDSNNQNSQ